MNILAAVDLSASTEKVVEETRKLAKRLFAAVWIIHVAEPEPDFVGYDPGPRSVRDTVSKEFHDEHRQLQAIAGRLGEAGIEATALLVRGPTAETILRKAAELEADVIVVGSHGRGAMYQLLVGSASEGVIHGADRPVLVVPTHERD